MLVACATGCTGPDEQASDASVDDAARANDATTFEAWSPLPGVDASVDAPVECGPADVSGFIRTWTPPAPPQHVCTTNQIELFYCACLLSGICATTCSRFADGGAPEDVRCAACLISQAAAPLWGPTVVRGGGLYPNVAGCVALQEGKPDGGGCGGAMAFADECEQAACNASCPLTDSTSYEAWVRCVASADHGGCAQYVDAATCAPALLEAGAPGAECLRPQTFDDAYMVLAQIFCGGAPDDAGVSDAGAVDGGAGDAASD